MKLPAREADYDQTIIDMAHAFGWKCVHFRAAMTSKGYRTPVSGDAKGWLDWIFFKPSKAPVFIEFKTGKNKPSPEQEEWLNLLQSVPGIKAGLLYLPEGLDQLKEILE